MLARRFVSALVPLRRCNALFFSTQPEAGQAAPEGASTEALLAKIADLEKQVETSKGTVKEMSDKYLRSLAEMENVRTRAAKDVEEAKKYALKGFAGAVVDVADNLWRAIGAIQSDGGANVKVLLEGVQATERILTRTLESHGVQRVDPLNQKFDPSLHAAMFEAPREGVESGTVIAVLKHGYTLNGRILRPAEVGVAKN
jgi:molecular chaperone GrpE